MITTAPVCETVVTVIIIICHGDSQLTKLGVRCHQPLALVVSGLTKKPKKQSGFWQQCYGEAGYPYCWENPNFLVTQCALCLGYNHFQKSSSIRYRPRVWRTNRTDRQT